MRYKEISGKELIDISSGSRLGVLGQTDIVINKETGKIESFILYDYKWFGMKKNADESTLSWEMIQKVGDDIILVDMEKI
ncbi:MAG TPA: YlmC/YmxH family sporulation protein [Pseudogracilibacillus sp.]|nr:YlmC/YmxH family sporulation protein [Pseudogracilibacillus sp.]